MCKNPNIKVGIKSLDFLHFRGKLAAKLTDGRMIVVPVKFFPDIRKLSLSERNDWMILDDPFSALDRSTEDAIFARLQDYAKDKVVFLISHRLYHFPQMRQILFMDGGKTAVGTHGELMASVPAYRRLYESQTGGEVREAAKE